MKVNNVIKAAIFAFVWVLLIVCVSLVVVMLRKSDEDVHAPEDVSYTTMTGDPVTLPARDPVIVDVSEVIDGQDVAIEPEEIMLEPHEVEVDDLVEVPSPEEAAKAYEDFVEFTKRFEVQYSEDYYIDIDNEELSDDMSFWAVSFPMDWVAVSSLLLQYSEIYETPLSDFHVSDNSLDMSAGDHFTFTVYTPSAVLTLQYAYTGTEWCGCVSTVEFL